MIKKILILLFLLLITAYLIVAVTAFNTKPADQVCKGMELIIKDSIDHGFISQKEVLRLLNGKKLSPVGKKMGDINTRLLCRTVICNANLPVFVILLFYRFNRLIKPLNFYIIYRHYNGKKNLSTIIF